MSGVAVMQMFFEFVGVVCVLASGLTPVYSMSGVILPHWHNHDWTPMADADCDLGVWRTKCSWTIGWNSSSYTDVPTYNFPFVQGAWVAPVMEAVYTITLVLGIATMWWQVAAARSALLRAKAYWWHHCGWALPLCTALLGGVYLLLVWHFGTYFWVAYMNNDGFWLNVRANDGNFPLITKPGFFVACAGVISFVASLLLLCMGACLKRPEAVADPRRSPRPLLIPEESQPVMGQVLNKTVYHTAVPECPLAPPQ